MQLLLNDLELFVGHRLRLFGSERLAQRLWKKDASLWSEEKNVEKQIESSLGWLTVTDWIKPKLSELSRFAEEIKNAAFTDILLLGMGGSSLCPDLFVKTFCSKEGYPAFRVLDSTDPDQIAAVEKEIRLNTTLIIVSSKSGNTLEVDALYRYFRSKIADPKQFVAITDENSPLHELAVKENFRKIFLNPATIGGRFSALSLFGFVPAALMGIDLEKFWSNANQMTLAVGSTISETDNVGVILGSVMGEAWHRGRNQMVLVLPKPLLPLGAWIEQLVAESTGKSGRGILPILTTDPHTACRPDQFAVSIQMADQPFPHIDPRIPSVQIQLRSLYDLGGEFFRWEIATAVAGHILHVNPFDQPNVEESKKKTRSLLDSTHESPSGKEEFHAPTFFSALTSKKYVAILAFVSEEAETLELLEKLKEAIGKRSGLATTLGLGPRYLHSTGQLHKGGDPSGHYLVITSEKQNDLQVPGRSYSFGALQFAQAEGDIAALTEAKRNITRIHFTTRVHQELQRLTASISA